MQRFFSLASLPLLAVAALAQAPCFEQNIGVLAPQAGGQAGFGDDVFFDLQPLGFNFPMAGLASTYSHVHISDNGICYLTNGASTTGAMGAGNGYQNTAYFVGAAGADPRIAPLFMDLWSDPANGGGVFVNALPGKFVITWVNMVEWWATTQPGPDPIYTFQVQLFANGDVYMYHDSRFTGATYTAQNFARVGVSQGDGVTDPGAVDLSTPGGNTNLNEFVLYEEFPVGPGFDLNDTVTQFIYGGTGYVQITQPCQPASHQNYGQGCYDISDSFYELLDPTVMDLSGLILTGTSIGGSPGTGYAVLVGPGPGNIAPGAAALALALGDDAQVATGSLGLTVGSNCWIALGAGNSNGFVPAVATFLNQPSDWITAWTDLQPNAAGSGLVWYEENGPIATVTYDGVYGWGTTNPNTVQFIYNTATGDFSIEFGVLSAGNPEDWLVGYSPAGPSTDGGAIDISAATVIGVGGSNVSAMALSASPSPVSTPTSGTNVTYSATNMFEFAPGSNTYIGLNVLSVSQNATGLDLGILGAPGCRAYVNSIDFAQVLFGATSTNSVVFALPAGTPPGFAIYAQAICLVQSGSLPNGQNPFGMITSNGVFSLVQNF